MEKEIKIWYDREGDYLEVLFEQKKGYFRETENDAVMEKVDEEGNIIGFSILKVSALRGLKSKNRFIVAMNHIFSAYLPNVKYGIKSALNILQGLPQKRSAHLFLVLQPYLQYMLQ